MTEAATAPPLASFSLRPYQERGVEFLRARSRALLGDDMGLGKTPQAILATADLAGPVLVVVPASLRWQWLSEHQFFAPARYARILSTAEARGLGKQTLIGNECEGDETRICSYETARNAVDALCGVPWDALICDEAHYLKSPRARRTRALRQIAARSRRVYLLTGTPVLARQSELVSILRVLHHDWRRGMSMSVPKLRAEITELQPDGLPAWMLRRRRVEVLTELPAKDRQWRQVTDRKRLDRFVRAADRWLERRVEQAVAECAAEGANAANIIRGLELAALGKRLASVERANVRAAAELAAEHLDQGARVVLGARHVGAVRSICARMRRHGYTVDALHGQVPAQERSERQQRFLDTSPAPAALALSYGVGSLGLNLQSAWIGIAAGLEWTPAILRQWEDRMHRMGQQRPVSIIYVLAGDRVEQHVCRRLREKLEVIASLVGDADAAANSDEGAADVLAAARQAIRDESPALAALAARYGVPVAGPTWEPDDDDELELLAREARRRTCAPPHAWGGAGTPRNGGSQEMPFDGRSGGGSREGWNYEEDNEPLIPVGGEGQPERVRRRALFLGCLEATAKSGKPKIVVDLGVEEGGSLVKITAHCVAGTSWLRTFCEAVGWPLENIDGAAIDTELAGKRYVEVTLSRQQTGDFAGRLQVEEFAIDSVEAAMGVSDEEVPF